MNDKFKANSFIVVPAAIVILIIYIFIGADIAKPTEVGEVSIVKVLPYLAVLVTAVLGVNVMTVLTIGIILTGIIGMCMGSYDLYGWFGSMGEGIVGMGELIIITMMAGGLLEIVKENGGIDFIISRLTKKINGKRGAEFSIAALVSVVDLCTANNTVAILWQQDSPLLTPLRLCRGSTTPLQYSLRARSPSFSGIRDDIAMSPERATGARARAIVTHYCRYRPNSYCSLKISKKHLYILSGAIFLVSLHL